MHRLTQADLRDLGRYPVSLQQAIVALFGVEPEACASGPAPATPAARTAHFRPEHQQGSGIEQ
ncbi:hypothetical protein [Novosphingobium cyanobacteriorum]|uniref:Uncharacterized protein n=1 Tax=Novosphingobium cyanobacteriorum TaxID=3024215 RepID=A0ABT6CKM1_9SPHN|nr:hypothetical protein [Novosphingobium cyanobacteriorum]MDF8334476.1 hypothetical protein [Novosphingobium cyanobacteriorum]